MGASIGPRAAAILDRLRRVDPAAGAVDRPRVERAVALHLERLGLPARPARWAVDGPAFLGEILAAGWARHRGTSTEPGPLQVAHRSQLLARLDPAVRATRDPAVGAALAALTARPTACRHGLPPEEETSAEAAARAAVDALTNLPAFGGFADRWAAAEAAARRLLRTAGIAEDGPDFFHALQAMQQIGGMLGPNPADLARQYLSDLAQAETAGVAESLGALEPMIDALEAGLWNFWPGPTDVLLVARPSMRFAGSELHDEKGPAVAWPGGASLWFLFGQAVDRDVVEAPATLDPARIAREPLPHRRGILIRRYGLDRFLREAGGTVVGESPAGLLLRFPDFALVEVRRPHARPWREYVCVPAAVATPEEGLAWTYGLTAPEYARLERAIYGPFAVHEMGPAARELLDRLRRVDRRTCSLDREAPTSAFARLFGGAKVSWITGAQAAAMRDEEFCLGHTLGDRDEEPYAESMGEAVVAAGLACDADAEQAAFDALDGAGPQHVVSREACEAVGVAAARHQGRIAMRDEDFDRHWMPWIRLYEAGAGHVWTEPGTLHVVARPALRVVDGLLDDGDAPAVAWPGGPEFRFRRGVRA